MATVLATYPLSSIDDPLSAMIAPPPNESLMDRDRRLRREAEAKRISDIIDEQIRQETSRRRKVNEIKLLLLGQSASGKSTLQKQFRLMYAPATLDLERSSWRPVVYINIIKSLRTILEAIEVEYDLNFDKLSISSGFSAGDLPSPRSPLRFDDDYGDDFPDRIPASAKGKGREVETDPLDPTPSGFISSSPRKSPITPMADGWSQQIMTTRLRLTPLLSMEEALAKRIGTEVKVAPGKQDFFVRTGWQSLHRRRETFATLPRSAAEPLTKPRHSLDSSRSLSLSVTSAELAHEQEQNEAIIRQVAALLQNSQDDVRALWQHPGVKGLIKRRRLRLEESSTYFLSHLHEVAGPDYVPTDDHLLRARLRTMGVVEHTFDVPSSIPGKVYSWHLYDVGGARGQRPRWVPFFEEATAIIFLAPISAFDQYLEEDGRMNRIDDSLQLFTLLCSNPLLKKVHLVLFLNKTDVLRKKLEMGVKVAKYITSYGERPNDYEHVSQYFMAHFKQVHRKNNVDEKRELYIHLTSVVDTKATRKIILNVQEALFRGHLKESSML